MKKAKLVAVVSAAMLASACQSAADRARIQTARQQAQDAAAAQASQMYANFDHWVGHSAAELIKERPPSQVVPLRDGSVIVRYTGWSTITVPVPTQRSVTVPGDDGPSTYALMPDPSGVYVGVDVTPRSPPRTLTFSGTDYEQRSIPCSLDYNSDTAGIIRGWHLSGPGC